MTRWTEQELQILKKRYPTHGHKIPNLLGKRSKSSIYVHASHLRIKRLFKQHNREKEIKEKFRINDMKKWLYIQYCKDEKSCREMSEIFGCSTSFIYRLLKRYRIPTRSPSEALIFRWSKQPTRIYQDKNWLIEQYWGFNLAQRDMAVLAGCRRDRIQYHMKKYNIPLRKTGETLKIKLNDGRLVPYNKISIGKEWLIKQYHNNNLTCKEIGKLMGCSHGVIWRRLKFYDIERRDARIRTTPKQRKMSFYKNKYKDYQRNAKARNLSFKLSFKLFKSLLDAPCCYCDKKPTPVNGIDRVDNSKGYIDGNVVTSCKYCNWSKHTRSEKEFAEYVLNLYSWANNLIGDDKKIELSVDK